MADDKTKTRKPDRDRINVNEDYELRDWSKKFGVTLRAPERGGWRGRTNGRRRGEISCKNR